jgi:hypothetical protein
MMSKQLTNLSILNLHLQLGLAKGYYTEKGGGISLGWYRLGRRELGTWIVVGVGKPMRD